MPFLYHFSLAISSHWATAILAAQDYGCVWDYVGRATEGSAILKRVCGLKIQPDTVSGVCGTNGFRDFGWTRLSAVCSGKYKPLAPYPAGPLSPTTVIHFGSFQPYTHFTSAAHRSQLWQMTTLSPKFLVFDSKTGSESEDGGLIHCSSKDANVQWPKSVPRGRPRKGGLCPVCHFYQ